MSKKRVFDLAKINPVIKAEIDPMRPVQEICLVIDAVTAFNRSQESAILQGIKEAVERRQEQLKGGEQNDKQIRRNNGN